MPFGKRPGWFSDPPGTMYSPLRLRYWKQWNLDGPSITDCLFPATPMRPAILPWIVTAILAVILPVALHAQDNLSAPRRIIQSAAFADQEPVYRLDRAGRPTGFAVDIMDAVAKRAGVSVQYQTFANMAAALIAMEAGTLDVIPLVTGIQVEPPGLIAYSTPIMNVPISVFVHGDAGDIADSFAGLTTLEGLRTAVVGGPAAKAWLMGNPDIIAEPYETLEQGLVALLARRVDALISPAPELVALARDSGVQDQIQVAGAPLVEMHRRMAIGGLNSELIGQLQRTVAAFVGGSEHAALIVKWYGEPRPFWEKPGYTWSGGAIALLLAAAMFGWRFLTVKRHSREQVAHIMALEIAISERNAAEGSAESTEARYRQLIDRSLQGVLVTRDFKVLFANQAYADIHHYDSPEDMFALDSILSLFAPHEHAKMRRNREARLRGESPPERYEYEGRTKDGATIWVEACNQLVDWEGETAIQAILVDITERKRAQLQLELSEARARGQANRTRHLLDSSPQALIIVDAAGRITSVNMQTERLFGYTAEALLGQPIEILVPERHRDAHIEQRESFFREPSVRYMGGDGRTVMGRCKDGREFPAEISLHPETGEIEMLVLVWISDISERVKLEEQFRGAQRMEVVGRLAGGIAHDFNNMLAVILSYTSFLQESIPPEDSRHDDVEQIRAAAERSAALTKQLLLFSRRQPLMLEETDLNQVIRSTERMLNRVIGEDISLACRLEPGLGRVVADKSQLEQVLMNLCVNARDAMPAGGHLHIETNRVQLDEDYAREHIGVEAGDYVVMAISDTGTGMDRETQARIFEPFFTTKEQGSGTGLGLSTVFGVIKQMGGNIWVYSELGQGTTFKIYLPLAQTAVTAQLDAQSTHMGRTSTRSATILLVEDEELVRKTADRILSEAGYSVISASHGLEALEIAENGGEAIDLLLTDVVMPKMNGVEVAERLSQLYPTAQVLYMSGYTEDAISSHGVLEPGVKIVFKPFTKGSLLHSVNEALT